MTGATITVKVHNGFTILPNDTLRDNRLSLKTRALLAIMVSLPEDWDYTVSGLAAICGVGKDAVRASLQELESCGYLTRAQRHTEAGHFSRNEYIVTDTPLSGYPSTGEPLTDNPTQQNKDCTNTPYSPPGGACTARTVVDAAGGNDVSHSGGAGTDRTAPDWTLFDRFWDLYPKKKGKESARRAWRRLNPNPELCRVMSQALKRDRNSWDWRKQGGTYIPYPATWLNGRRWEDEPDPPHARPESGWAPDPEVL